MGSKTKILVAVLGLVLIGSAGWEIYQASQVAEKFPPPGLLVDVDGRKLQLDCRGSGSPTVLLESGGDDIFGSSGWAYVHDDIASMTRVCAYSRSGYMWSERRAEALQAEDGARDLHAALLAAGESPPFLPVGYSRGSFNTLIFVDLFGAEVDAVLFLEPRPTELEERRLQAGIAPGSDRPLALAKFGKALRWTGLPRAFSSYCETDWYSKEIIDACKAYLPQSLDGMISEDSAYESVRARAAKVKDLGDRPVLVLTRQLKDAWLGSDPVARASAQKSEDLWRELQAEMASWSSAGEQRIVPDSSHQLPFTHPQAVLAGLSDILALAREQP